MSAKLVPTFADRGCRVVSATDPHGRILGFLDRSRYYFFRVAPQLYSRGWVDPVPDPLLLRKSGSAGNRTRDLWICSQELWPLEHRGGQPASKQLVSIHLLNMFHIPVLVITQFLHINTYIHINKNLWEELILYFLLIRHGLHVKGRVQQFLYCCVYIRCRGWIFTEPLPSNDRGIHI
jgi:hypothetical protein